MAVFKEKKVLEMQASKSTEVVSFDVFDTLISRRVASPLGIFHVMQSRLAAFEIPLTKGQISSFAKTRVFCERLARRQTQAEDVTLDQIYQQLGSVLFLDKADTNRLQQVELETEAEFIMGVPEMIRFFHQTVEHQSRILLISDTYFSRFTIEGLLDRVDSKIREHAKLYISSEVMKTKRSGNLFRHVLAEEGISPSNLQHFGDNKFSDYLVPRSLGINAIHATPTKLKRYELIGQSDDRPETGQGALAWQVTAGLSRTQRLLDRDNKFLTGYAIAGPVLVPYVAWLLKQAEGMRIKKLYFVARDGQILHAIAQRIQEFENRAAVELHYLHGSRQAWHLPAIRKIGEHEFAWIFQTRSVITIENIAKRIGLSTEELSSGLKDAGVSGIEPAMKLTPVQVQKIKTAILTNSGLKNLILERARVARESVQKYLREQGMFDGTSFAIVDVGWTARSQDSLLSIIDPDVRPPQMKGFYFGLVHYTQCVGPTNRKYAYALDPEYSQFHSAKLYHFIHFVEVFASADHGSTMGYQKDHEGRMVPILDGQGDQVRNWGLETFQAGILSFAEHWHPYKILVSNLVMQNRINQLVEYFMDNLAEPEIANVIGAFPYSSDQEGWNQTEFGPQLSIKQSLAILRLDPASRRSYCLWPEGSAARSGRLVRMLLHPRNRWISEIAFHQSEFLKRALRFVVRRTPRRILEYVAFLMPPKLALRIKNKLPV